MTAQGENNPGLGILFITLGMGCISINDMLIKALSGDYPLHQMVFVRSAIGICFSLALVQFEGMPVSRSTTPGPIRRHCPHAEPSHGRRRHAVLQVSLLLRDRLAQPGSARSRPAPEWPLSVAAPGDGSARAARHLGRRATSAQRVAELSDPGPFAVSVRRHTARAAAVFLRVQPERHAVQPGAAHTRL